MQTIGNKGILSMYLGESNISSFSIGQQQIWTPDQPIPAENGYVTFSSDAPFAVNISSLGRIAWDGTVEYSTDKETWTTWDGTSVNSNASNEIYFRGSNNTVFSGKFGRGFVFTSDVDITISGNIENLLDYETVMAGNHPPMAEHCFNSCFYKQTGLLTTGELGSTILAPYCYAWMYLDCVKLQELPILPALNMTEGCYMAMFGIEEYDSSIKLSETQTGLYVNEFRIPSSGIGNDADATDWNFEMFNGSTGTFTGDPQINTTYYYYMEYIEPGPEPEEPEE